MIKIKLSPQYMAAYFMLIFLTLSFFATLITFITDYKNILPEKYLISDVIKGHSASLYNNQFEDSLVIRDYAIGVWGAISYGLFNTGSKGVIIGLDDWLFTTEEFEQHDDEYKEQVYKQNLIIELNEFFKKRNIELIIALLPSKARIYEDKLGNYIFPQSRKNIYPGFRAALLKKGVNVPDLNFLLKNTAKKEQVFMRMDTHWTAKGAGVIAERLAKSSKSYEQIEHKIFQTQYSEKKLYEGDLEKYIKTGFIKKWLSPAPENIQTLKTIENNNDITSNDLFAEQVIPVALVGTSYSAIAEWNFAGALKTAFQADVLNVSDEGMGPLEPMANFLKNTNWDNTKIKIIIWEIPERFISVKYDDVEFPIMGNK